MLIHLWGRKQVHNRGDYSGGCYNNLVQDDGVLYHAGRNGGSKKWSDFGCILQVEL